MYQGGLPRTFKGMRNITGAVVAAVAAVTFGGTMGTASAAEADYTASVDQVRCTRDGFDVSRISLDLPRGYGVWFRVMRNGRQVRLSQGITTDAGRAAMFGVRVRGDNVKRVQVTIFDTRRPNGWDQAERMTVRLRSGC